MPLETLRQSLGDCPEVDPWMWMSAADAAAAAAASIACDSALLRARATPPRSYVVQSPEHL